MILLGHWNVVVLLQFLVFKNSIPWTLNRTKKRWCQWESWQAWSSKIHFSRTKVRVSKFFHFSKVDLIKICSFQRQKKRLGLFLEYNFQMYWKKKYWIHLQNLFGIFCEYSRNTCRLYLSYPGISWSR